jgi:hypothetical protein
MKRWVALALPRFHQQFSSPLSLLGFMRKEEKFIIF